jgi:hypothetical protein
VVGGLADEERYTFSSLMTMLSEAESELKRLHEIAEREISEPHLRSLMSEYTRKDSIRMEMMRRTRVESVVEIMLEPITSLKLTEPIAAIKTAIENQSLGTLEKVVTVEKAISEIYSNASPKIMPASADAGELLARLSRESAERVHELERVRQTTLG